MLEIDKEIKEKLDTIDAGTVDLWAIADAYSAIGQETTAKKLSDIASRIARAKISLTSLLRLNGKADV